MPLQRGCGGIFSVRGAMVFAICCNHNILILTELFTFEFAMYLELC